MAMVPSPFAAADTPTPYPLLEFRMALCHPGVFFLNGPPLVWEGESHLASLFLTFLGNIIFHH